MNEIISCAMGEYMLVDAGRQRGGGVQTQSVGRGGAASAKGSGKSDRVYQPRMGLSSAGSRDQSKGVGAPR